MSGDGFDGGDLITGFLFGMLLSGGPRQRATAHTHGDHWHQHVAPAGDHIHDAHPDGPIRMVPPRPEQLEAERARRARIREAWAVVLALLGLLLMEVPWVGLTAWGLALGLSATARSFLAGVCRNAIGQLARFPEEDDPKDLVPVGHQMQSDGTRIDTRPWTGVELELVGKPHVRLESHGRFTILVRVANRGSPLSSVYLTASLLDGLQVVGTACGWLDGPDVGQVRTAQLVSFEQPPKFDDIVLQVDEVVIPSEEEP